MSFFRGFTKIILQGLLLAKTAMISGKQLRQSWDQVKVVAMSQCHPREPYLVEDKEDQQVIELQTLLDKYAVVFKNQKVCLLLDFVITEFH